MTERLAWPAPAKLNLFLHVTGLRPDGYHELQTVFQFLDHGDTVEVGAGDGTRLVLEGGVAGVAAADNLALRAAHRLREAAGLDRGAVLRLWKGLPVGGGLGGGSSDAATVLTALDRLWGLGLGEDRLAAIGLGLGADVPVFVRGRAAWGEGVGERLTPVALDEPWYLVVHPGCHVSTAEVFRDPGLTRDSPPEKIAGLFDHVGRPMPAARVQDLMAATRNDCEPVVCRRYPPVRAALEWLSTHGPARLTGTGACVFAPFPARAQAETVLTGLPGEWTGFVARGRNESPLRRLRRSLAPMA